MFQQSVGFGFSSVQGLVEPSKTRRPILDLGERLASSSSQRGSARVFERWAALQPWSPLICKHCWANCQAFLHTYGPHCQTSACPGRKLPTPMEFYVDSVGVLVVSLCLCYLCCSDAVFFAVPVRSLGVVCLQDWDDEHGKRKQVQINVLLPHEIVGNFLKEGETMRMTGHGTETGLSLCQVYYG